MKNLRKKIENLHDTTIYSDAYYSEELVVSEIDFLKLFTISSLNKTVIELGNDRIHAVNYTYNGTNSIIIIYEINFSETNKRVSDKMMKLIEVLEDFYVTLGSTNVIKQNSISYLVVTKNLDEDRIGE